MIRVNLGCGKRPLEDFVNIDNRAVCKPDICCDVTEGLPFKDNEVSHVVATDFLEHIQIGKVVPLIEDIWRVLKPGATFECVTPSTDGRGAFQDPTHVSFWNENSFLYFMDDEHRELYGIRAKFTGTVESKFTNRSKHIIHVFAKLQAVK